MDLVTLVLELTTSMLVLATKPFSLIRTLCVLGVKCLSVIIQTWIEILRCSIGVHFSIIQNIICCIYVIISLPSRLVFALQRESLLQSQLYELQIEIEKLIWSKEELEVRLHKAIREIKMMEAMLNEVEDEHDEAIGKIEQLESKLKNTKEENLRLKEAHGKLQLPFQSVDDKAKAKAKDHDNDATDKSNISSHTRQHKQKYPTEFKSGAPTCKVPPNDPIGTYTKEFLGQRALMQSLFSSILSLIVGMIIWEAEKPCMPLVVALYVVVGLSLKSVVQFFSTIENKPASDAVSLLSLNWFILGALTYPTLPRVAYMLHQ